TFFLVWVVVGILPAAISTEAPHSNRSLMALPGFFGLSIVGVLVFVRWLKERYTRDSAPVRAAFGVFVIVHLLLFTTYFSHYMNNYSAIATHAFNEGYLSALEIAKKYELGEEEYPRVEQIV